jgi:hypothetical protein
MLRSVILHVSNYCICWHCSCLNEVIVNRSVPGISFACGSSVCTPPTLCCNAGNNSKCFDPATEVCCTDPRGIFFVFPCTIQPFLLEIVILCNFLRPPIEKVELYITFLTLSATGPNTSSTVCPISSAGVTQQCCEIVVLNTISCFDPQTSFCCRGQFPGVGDLSSILALGSSCPRQSACP